MVTSLFKNDKSSNKNMRSGESSSNSVEIVAFDHIGGFNLNRSRKWVGSVRSNNLLGRERERVGYVFTISSWDIADPSGRMIWSYSTLEGPLLWKAPREKPLIYVFKQIIVIAFIFMCTIICISLMYLYCMYHIDKSMFRNNINMNKQ